MRETLRQIIKLVERGLLHISEHGYDELAEDGLSAREVVSGTDEAVIVEDYPDFHKGPCVLVRQRDRNGQPIHVVWGIPKGYTEPAVLVTAYRPDPRLWDHSFLRRRR